MMNTGSDMKLSEEDRRRAAVQSMRATPGYPWFPCRICVAAGFNGEGGCDHTARERAVAAGVNFGPSTKTAQ